MKTKDKIILMQEKIEYTQHPSKVKIILSKINLGIFYLIKIYIIFNSPNKYSPHNKK